MEDAEANVTLAFPVHPGSLRYRKRLNGVLICAKVHSNLGINYADKE